MTVRTDLDSDFQELRRLLGNGQPATTPIRPGGANEFYVEPFYNRDYLAPVGPVRIINHTDLGEDGAQLAERPSRD
jgi:hypothetical protein